MDDGWQVCTSHTQVASQTCEAVEHGKKNDQKIAVFLIKGIRLSHSKNSPGSGTREAKLGPHWLDSGWPLNSSQRGLTQSKSLGCQVQINENVKKTAKNRSNEKLLFFENFPRRVHRGAGLWSWPTGYQCTVVASAQTKWAYSVAFRFS